MKRRFLGGCWVVALGCGGATQADMETVTGDTGESTSASTETGSEDSTETGAEDTDTGMDVDEIQLVRTAFVIPAGTTVQEFEFEAAGVAPPFDTTGGLIVVSVLDLTHPDREQSELCLGSHPLNGCATVDYGAFGTTHDNRIYVEKAGGGAAELHLYKDRTLQAAPEPLPPAE